MLAKKSGLEKSRGADRRAIMTTVVMAAAATKGYDEECKDGKGDADVDFFLGKIFEGYSHRDPKNHQNNIFRLNEEIALRSKMETELSFNLNRMGVCP